MALASTTHGSATQITVNGSTNRLLQDLILITNPDEPRGGSLNGGYDNYSTAVIDLLFKEKVNNNPIEYEYKTLYELNDKIPQYYEIKLSSNIDELVLEDMGFVDNESFGKFRAIAALTAMGRGNIVVDFVPKNCVGDIKSFSVKVPCKVGERATGFEVINNNVKLDIIKQNQKEFKTTASLYDAGDKALGQAFKFEMLSVNTLSELKDYRITINKYMLNIADSNSYHYDAVKNESPYIKGSDGKNLNLNDIVTNKYKYQISLLNNGRAITFYLSNDGNYLISEPLTQYHTIWIKWVRVEGKDLSGTNFGISISNTYDGQYNTSIVNNGFEQTLIKLNIGFERICTVESISYQPVMVSMDNSGDIAINLSEHFDNDRKFYFHNEMLVTSGKLEDKNRTYYGFKITEVRGLNGVELTNAELENINVRISLSNSSNIGLSKFYQTDNILKDEDNPFTSSVIFNFDISNLEHSNLYLIGKVRDLENTELDIALGEYTITMQQDAMDLLDTINVSIYKLLEKEDIEVTIPTANFAGSMLNYQSINLIANPNRAGGNDIYELSTLITNGGTNLYSIAMDIDSASWATNYDNYYTYDGNTFTQATDTYDSNKTYYVKLDWATDYNNYYTYNGETFTQATDTYDSNKTYYVKLNWGNDYKHYYEQLGGSYIQLTSSSASVDNNKIYYKKMPVGFDTNKAFILSTSSQYQVNVNIGKEVDGLFEDLRDFINFKSQSVTAEIIGGLYGGYATSIIADGGEGNLIQTGANGSYYNERNYIKLTYTIKSQKYDYCKLNTADPDLEETYEIYIYVYEPINFAELSNTVLYKYNDDKLTLEELKNEHSKHTLNVNLNNGSESIFNYVDVSWYYDVDGVKDFSINSKDSATFIFGLNPMSADNTHVKGIIVVTLNQFGARYPISCEYQVKNPIKTEEVVIDTPISSFKSGGGYINLKLGEQKTIEASNKSSKGEVSIPGVKYIVCSTSGYQLDGVVEVDANGTLTALSAGKAKLIVVATDALTKDISGVTDYFNYSSYINTINKSPYVVIDIIVSNGTKENPFLISSVQDFENIKNDYYITNADRVHNKYDDTTSKNDYYYALTNDIDLNGKAINFKDFEGQITSYQQSGSTNRFTIFGVMLTEDNANLFTNLTANENSDAVLCDINIYLDINYKAETNSGANIGLIGTNKALIKDVTITVNGDININSQSGTYYIGSMVAKNQGTIEIIDTKLVGVKGNIVVSNGSNATIYLGGLVGENTGNIIGANIPSSIADDGLGVKYEVYYDNQGATADVNLVVKSSRNGAIGGVVGYNNLGTVENVYAMGEVSGIDDSKNLIVDNVGGIIGKNLGNKAIEYTIASGDNPVTLNSVTINSTKDAFQVINSYSSVFVKGRNNVGGAIGYDSKGAYYKTYYEVYQEYTGVEGRDNVGGLIGYTEDSNLMYCYANSFALNYKSSVSVYDIVGNSNVGGLVGYGKSSRETNFAHANDKYLNIVNSPASVSINANSNVAGIMGWMQGFGAIYTSYFYGVIDATTYHGIANFNSPNNIRYNNVYWIVNDRTKEARGYDNTIFKTNPEYNNGQPYIEYTDNGVTGNLVSIIPTQIHIASASDTALQSWYRKNDLSGEYIWNGSDYVVYEGQTGQRYSKMADLAEIDSVSANYSDYRKHALVLYYYQFSDISGENATRHMRDLNTVDMHDILNDNKIKLLPDTIKRFNLRSSNNSVVSVLTGGKLLLNNEGQAIITIISTLNPSVTASFVVYVRSKVLDFNLYSNANISDEYNISGSTLRIVKNSSKIIYADYSSTITIGGVEYTYKMPTNMKVKFTIEYNDGTGIKTDIDGDGYTNSDDDIDNYIEFSGAIKENNSNYWVNHGDPITITILKHITAGYFEITAKPYVVVDYNGGEKIVECPSTFARIFKVVTKQGATGINVNKTQLDMMPSTDKIDITAKIATEIKQETLNFEIESIGENWETLDPSNPSNKLKFVDMLDMLDIYYGGTPLTGWTENNSNRDLIKTSITSNVRFTEGDKLQTEQLSIKLNDKSHYINEAFTLQVTIYVMNGDQRISTSFVINVLPQTILSMVTTNYRMKDNATEFSIDNAYQSDIIRPGSSNLLTIDIAPSIAVYEYLEIKDITNSDKILMQQVDKNLNLLNVMDSWVDSGIKLIKNEGYSTSKLYVKMRLPDLAEYNINHVLEIVAYDVNGKALYTTYTTIQAVLYPSIELIYTAPNGVIEAKADTRKGSKIKYADANANLALGVEANMIVNAYNIDEGSLQCAFAVKLGNDDYTSNYTDILTIEYRYGRYILRFIGEQSEWLTLLDKEIHVKFTASKSLNGIVETCEAVIKFEIQRIVIHGASMTHSTSNGQIYGDWGEEFASEFCFDETDISYYWRGYWNAKYTLGSTDTTGMANSQLKSDLDAIHNVLEDLNNNSSDIELYFVDRNTLLGELNNELTLPYNYYQDKGVEISNNNQYIFKARMSEPNERDYININNMKFVVRFKVSYNLDYPQISSSGTEIINEHGFNVTPKSSRFDEYIELHNQAEFEDMIEGKFYKLANDIELTNYTPLNTAIGGLVGNGYTLTIKSFNKDQLVLNYLTGNVYIGLFGTLAENSIIENLKLEYANINIDFNYEIQNEEQNTNEIFFGGIAGRNLGVITNVLVEGGFTLNANNISPERIDMGGITAVNGVSNSTKIATITGSTANIRMQALSLIGGIAGTNYGKITNTNFGGAIRSISNNLYATQIFTAGFVVNNEANAYISLSYVYGSLGVYDIYSVGRTAGFVQNNRGTINNCYVNHTSISSQGNIGGFVYQSSGTINNCYAYASMSQSLFYEEFIYSTENLGTFTNCYVLTDSNKNFNIKGLSKKPTSQLKEQSTFEGFVFANNNNGVWSMDANGPTQLNSGFNSDSKTYDNICNIYDVETYQKSFERYTVQGESDSTDESITFRIVRDIDFGAEEFDGNPYTYNKILMSNLEGNDMTIKNYNIYKTSGMESIGLFGSIENVYVRNLILQPTSVKASSSTAVGALAGVINNSKIYNIVIDNETMLILGKNAVGGLAGIIKGNLEVSGISSNVSVFASYNHTTADQYNLYMSYNVVGAINGDNLNEVSYAGSVAGIIDGHGRPTVTYNNRTLSQYYTISEITIGGSMVNVGETVGGAFGLIGECTLVKNLECNLTENAIYKGVYVAGGLVGENRGILQNVNIYAYRYENGTKQFVSTKDSFNGFARVNGAIVGLNIGGLINKSSSDIDVYSNKYSTTAGGIIGRNIQGLVYGCTISGSVYAYFAGGIVGTDYSRDEVIKQYSGYGTATSHTAEVYNILQVNKVGYSKDCFIEDKDMFENKLFVGNIVTDKFVGNIVTDKFITTLINNRSTSYLFNSTFIEGSSSEMIKASAVLGLTIGMTNQQYSSDITYNSSDKSLIIDHTLKTDDPLSPNSTTSQMYLVGNGKVNGINPVNVKINNATYGWIELGQLPITDANGISFSMPSITKGATNWEVNGEDTGIAHNDNTYSKCELTIEGKWRIIDTDDDSYNTDVVVDKTVAFNIMLLSVIGYDDASYESWSPSFGYSDEYIVFKANVN
ncbi:MAG: hypothetical protein ACLRFE_01800 [Clostridia bacterium]